MSRLEQANKIRDERIAQYNKLVKSLKLSFDLENGFGENFKLILSDDEKKLIPVNPTNDKEFKFSFYLPEELQFTIDTSKIQADTFKYNGKDIYTYKYDTKEYFKSNNSKHNMMDLCDLIQTYIHDYIQENELEDMTIYQTHNVQLQKYENKPKSKHYCLKNQNIIASQETVINYIFVKISINKKSFRIDLSI